MAAAVNVARSESVDGPRRYRPSDAGAVLAFRGAMYGPGSAYADTRFLAWLYESPGPYDGPSPLWLYHQRGVIVGQVAGRVAKIEAGPVEVDGRWMTELVTAPAARTRGVASALISVLCENTSLALALDVSADARGMLLRRGWMDVGVVPLYVRPFDVAALLRDRGWGGPVTRAAVALGYPTFDAIVRAVLGVGGGDFVTVEGFDGAADALWRRASHAYAVLQRRDAAYLNWRYVAFPTPDLYALHYVWRRGQLMGWLVTRMGERHGRPTAELVDYFCEPRSLVVLLAHAVTYLRSTGASAAYCLHLNVRARAAFRLLGFSERSSGWPLMLHARTEVGDQLPLLRDPRSWFLTAGDGNVDRPRGGTVYATE